MSRVKIANHEVRLGHWNVFIGVGAGAGAREGLSKCVVIGTHLPAPTKDGTVRIGNTDCYMDLNADGTVSFVGAEALLPQAVLEALGQAYALAHTTGKLPIPESLCPTCCGRGTNPYTNSSLN